MQFDAEKVSLITDEYSTLLALGGKSAENYILLGLTNEPDQQDRDLGMAGVHIDAGNMKIDGYDLIDRITMGDRSINISLLNTTDAHGIGTIDVNLLDENANLEEIRGAVYLFQERIDELR